MTLEWPGGRRGPARVLGVVSDLDGTLLRSDGSLSPTTMSMLDALTGLGVPLVVATARTPRALQKVSGHDSLGRVVCANGAIVWDAKRDEVVKERCFDPSALAVAVHRLREALPGTGVALLSARTMFLDETYPVASAAQPLDAISTATATAFVVAWGTMSTTLMPAKDARPTPAKAATVGVRR